LSQPTYTHEALRIIQEELGWDNPSDDEERLYIAFYALLALTLGEEVTRSAIHDAWSLIAVLTSRHSHPSLVPFDELPEHVKALDDPYAEVVKRVARKLREKEDRSCAL